MAVDALLDRAARALPWRMIGWGTAAFLLLLPVVAMQFTGEVNWTVGDFLFAAVMFALVGGTLELAVWKSRNWSYGGAVAIAAVAALLHVWITGAVGIIGSEDNPGNLLYLGVVVIAIFGAILTLGRAAEMAWVMGATALAELLVPVVAYAAVADPRSEVLLPEVLGFAVVFTGMWLVSATLFSKAARERPGS